MSEARRQRRKFKRAYDKLTKLGAVKAPTLSSSSIFNGIPVGELFKEKWDKHLKDYIKNYEVNTSDKQE